MAGPRILSIAAVSFTTALAGFILAVAPPAAADDLAYQCFVEQVVRGGPDESVDPGDDGHYEHRYDNCELVSADDCAADGTESRCKVCVLKQEHYHYIAQQQEDGHWEDQQFEESGAYCV